MKNKHVGVLVIGISLIIAFVVFLFNYALTEIVSTSCEHGTSCPMYGTISEQTYLSLGIAAFIFFIGVFLFFSKPEEKIVFKKTNGKIKVKLSGLERDEKLVVELLAKENRAMFQRTLMEKLEIGKVKTTRLLDKLESKGLIERKRRGMNNIVVLK